MIQFGHEKLKAYPYAIKFVALVARILDESPRGYGKLLDQLHRAAASVPLNIAEGSGKNSLLDRKRFYSIARGSAMECAAVLDVLHELRVIEEKTLNEGKELLNAVVSILTAICKK